ncbi:rna pseudouridine synthase superfamily protein, partial [Cystoisospora suis]
MKLRKLSVKVVEEGEETIGMRLPIFASRYLIGSYPAALHLLRRKHLFLIKKGTPLTDHLRFLRLQRERPDGWRDVCVEEGDRIYYPHGLDLLHKAKEEIVSNKERESKEGADELNGETKVFDLRKRLLYKDTDFLAIDKPFGLPSKSPLSFSKKRMNKEECSSSSPISVSSILHQLRFSMDENPSILNVLSSDTRGLVLPLAVQRGGSVAITRWKLLKTTGGGGDRGWQGFDVGRGEAKHRLYGFSLLELEIQQPQFRHQIRAHCLY